MSQLSPSGDQVQTRISVLSLSMTVTPCRMWRGQGNLFSPLPWEDRIEWHDDDVVVGKVPGGGPTGIGSVFQALVDGGFEVFSSVVAHEQVKGEGLA